MLNKILDKLITKTNGHIITNSKIEKYINNANTYKIEIIDDSRSGAFFAFGESKISMKPSILIIDEEDAASTYTAITEAKYQDVPIFIILISKNESWKFWDFCIEQKYIINTENDLNDMIESVEQKFYSPILIKVYEEEISKNKKIEKLGLEFERLIDSNTQIFIHNIEYYTQSDKIIVDLNSKYGIVSKYVGYIQHSDYKNILICREEDLEMDINIFNSRYINDKFKVIVISKKSNSHNLENWVVSNNITYVQDIQLNENNLSNIVNSSKACLLMIKGGE